MTSVYLWIGDLRNFPLFQLGNIIAVLSEVEFCAYKHERSMGAVVTHLWVPLCSNVLQRVRVHQ